MAMKGEAIAPLVENLQRANLPALLEYGCVRFALRIGQVRDSVIRAVCLPSWVAINVNGAKFSFECAILQVNNANRVSGI